MIEVVSIRFKNRGKIYYFDPAGVIAEDGAVVLVETAKGLELGECVKGNHYVTEDSVVPPLRPVIRTATEEDLRTTEANKAKELEAMEVCRRKILDHGLDMKLVDVECNFEGNKIMFFFTSDGRVDFRDLVKDLASIFRMRIELRQIGVRDEAKMLGGIGMCGRTFCCSQFLNEFQPVSTKMAKTQSMSLNPTKISGSCGRLMCCLRYEQEAYEELVKHVPKNGAFVETTGGYGNVMQSNILRQKIKVKLDGAGEQAIKVFDADEVAAIPGGRPKPGEPLPSILVVKPKPRVVEEPEEDSWQVYLTSDTAPEPPPSPAPNGDKKKQRPRRRGGHGSKPSAQAQEQKKQPEPKSQQNQGAEPKPRPANNRNRRRRKPKPKSE